MKAALSRSLVVSYIKKANPRFRDFSKSTRIHVTAFPRDNNSGVIAFDRDVRGNNTSAQLDYTELIGS
jgi:hypothetical protein